MTLFTISYIALWILVLLLCFVALDYLKRTLPRKRSLGLQDMGFPMGQQMPIKQVNDLSGRTIPLANPTKKGTVLVFTSATCASCKTLYPVLEPFQKRHPEVEVVMLYLGDTESGQQTKGNYGMSFPIVPTDSEGFADFEVNTFPFAYYISPDGKVQNKGGMSGSSDLELLLAS